MIPIILLIAKAAAAIDPVHVEITEADLADYLKTVKDACKDGFEFHSFQAQLQKEIDRSASILVAVHTASVLAQIATKDPTGGTTITVSGFTPETKALINKRDFPYQLEGVSGDDIPKNLGRYIEKFTKCLEKVPTGGGDMQTHLATCREASGNGELKCKACYENAVAVVEQILKGIHLEQIPDAIHVQSLLEKWNEKKSELDILESDLAGNDDSVEELTIRQEQIRKMLARSNHFFSETLSRLDPQGPGNDLTLKAAINNFPQTFTPGQKEAWQRILQSLYGAVAWHISEQMALAVKQAELLLEHFRVL